MTLLLSSFITTIVLLLILWIIIEVISGNPLFFFKTILLRNFKIILFNGLHDNGENEQLYVIAGVTWFGIPITYQAYPEDLHTMDYSTSFTIGKKNWIHQGSHGFVDYMDAKSQLILVKEKFINKKKEVIWVSNALNEDKL